MKMLFVMFTLLIYIVTSSQTKEGNSCFPETFLCMYVNILDYNEIHCFSIVFINLKSAYVEKKTVRTVLAIR